METLLAPPPAKGRPREFCVDEALAAALRVFWQHGYEGASLTELTGAMGITKPSLYAAFGNKEALFHKALDLYEREKLAYMKTALDAPTSRGVAERLLFGALEMQSSSCDPKGCLGVISSLACSPQNTSIRDDVLARRLSSQTAMIERFTRAKAEGDLPDSVDPTALANYLITVMQGLAVQASSGMTCPDLTALVDTTLSVWPGR
ncbi:TetR/AcrR family transcriptional regulator [Sphingomonas naphthae]|uniref:TetR/AcrR family transcriptional regulator n=1 Tax=Sphingomonas naphthae TaxID=1813468 RepID=A0ABY7THP1_9SPHN|nr:TetR/AcrR family transcriptional regulator [Sphingomonas naphthae]WCT71849.1 TetR/AcrR family transcriptional regulator [Sphingomonas naphthae]